MQNFVKKYVRHCDICKHNKKFRFKKPNFFQFLSIFDRKWLNININFVSGISVVIESNAIYNVVCRLFKKRHHIVINKKIDVEKLTNFFVQHVWKFHGFFRFIISNRGFQFVNDFWKFLCKKLNINAKLFTVWHSETNGQTERFNEIIRQYFRTYVNYLQNGWFEWLSLIEFVGNNIEFEIIKITPFFANKNFVFEWILNLLNFHSATLKKLKLKFSPLKWKKFKIFCETTCWSNRLYYEYVWPLGWWLAMMDNIDEHSKNASPIYLITP